MFIKVFIFLSSHKSWRIPTRQVDAQCGESHLWSLGSWGRNCLTLKNQSALQSEFQVSLGHEEDLKGTEE